MISRHSHIGGTRWIHLWIEIKELLHLDLDIGKLFYKKKPVRPQVTPQEDIQQFLYHTSHNLKGPVSRLKGLINLILLEANDLGSQQYVGKIDQEVKQMEKILSRLQTISDVLTVDHKPAKCDLEDILSQALSRYQNDLQEKNIFLRIHAAKNFKFWTSKPLLKLVLENLIDNAIQYSSKDRDQAKIEISLEKEDGELYVSIEDNGEGIRKESEERIYEIFFRDSDRSTGGGLGLYMVQEALKKLGGTISHESEVGKFSRFSFNIPEEIPDTSRLLAEKLKAIS